MVRRLINTAVTCLFCFGIATVFGEEPISPRAKRPKKKPVGAESRIIDGINVPESTFPSVGRLVDQTGFTFCTGTLIGPDAVLTAGHCVTFPGTGAIDPDTLNKSVRFNGTDYPIKEVIVHPTWDGQTEVEGVYDIAVLRLATPVTGISPSKLYTEQPRVGMEILLVGFGREGTGLTGETFTRPEPGTVNFGFTYIDYISGAFIKWSFDEMLPPDYESNTAHGDSGGPAFIETDVGKSLAGVTSGGRDPTAAFGDIAYDTRVDRIVPWLLSLIWNPRVEPGTRSLRRGEQAVFLAMDNNIIDEEVLLPVVNWSATSGSITPAGIFTATEIGGPFLVTATFADGQTASSLITVTEDLAPIIVSAPSALPATGTVGSPVWFSASAQDPEGKTLVYHWDFGDGSTGLGVAPIHVYSQTGSYSVNLSVSDGLNMVSSSLSLQVQAPSGKVWVKRIQVRLTFNGRGGDELCLQGGLSPGLGDDFDCENTTVTLNAGGHLETFLLDAQGRASTSSGIFILSSRKGQRCFNLRLTGAFSKSWAEYGLLDADLRNVPVELPLSITVGDKTFAGSAGMLYTAKAGHKGMAR